ncbi:MAG: tRNA (adenosine(37)-N6)-threonylcarbamoyltransferase complex dimerization subunit type 1 TsaB [Ruminococcaceae bacterium]|nr:tRNA (adenosine(37)-N6)-threonylcarbamoyltransferase complex dimerization subunit type 1 TsaB [Oscillospiraceae bacterium]
MLVLGVDTTAGIAAVSLIKDEKIVCEYSVNSGNTHSRTLLPMIESVLKSAEKKISDIDLFALAAGPGSFTGVRIGAATVKGLAFADNIPCIGVSVLEAMAEGLRDLKGIICPVINARRGQVYCAVFNADGENIPERLTSDDTLMADELANLLSQFDGENIYFAGDGTEVVMPCCDGLSVCSVPAVMNSQSAAGVAFLGLRKYLFAADEERERFNHFNLSPIYLKKPQAEREREERLAAEAE